jgi:hypothetical protein
MFDFRFNTPIHSLNQGQGSVFMLRECAESISRIKLPPQRSFSDFNVKIRVAAIEINNETDKGIPQSVRKFFSISKIPFA